MIAVPKQTLQAAVDYLTTKPFREVNGLLALLMGCKTVDDVLAVQGTVMMTKADAERLAAFDASSPEAPPDPPPEEAPGKTYVKTNGKPEESKVEVEAAQPADP